MRSYLSRGALRVTVLLLAVLLACGGFAAEADAGTPKKFAVLVSINNYPSFPGPLKYCVNDSDALKDVLVRHCGFGASNIFELKNSSATIANMQNTITNQLAPLEGPDDTVIIFFSGHGWPDVGSGVGIYLSDGIMYDSQLNVLLSGLESTKQGVFFDSCFSGGFKTAPDGSAAAERADLRQGSILNSMARSGRVVMAACDAGEESDEYDALWHGLFTYYLCPALISYDADTKHDGYIDTDEAYAYLNPRVIAYSQDAHARDPNRPLQHPQISSGIPGGLILGDLATVLHVSGVNPASGPVGSTVTVTGTAFGTGGAPSIFFGAAQAQVVSWTSTQVKCKVPDGLAGEVELVARSGAESSNAAGFNVTNPTWYLAEGSTAWGYSCYVTVENPNPAPVTIRVSYQTPSGPVARDDFTMAAQSQATINPESDLGATDFSTRVDCLERLPISVDRTMTWTGPGAVSPEGHCSVGVMSPSATWYLPEGSTNWGFECWLLIQNPNATPATCGVTYMIEGQGPKTVPHTVPANSRASFSMKDDIGYADASIAVTSDVPVIPERAMYRNSRREGHDSIGTTTPANDCFLAEGAVGYSSAFTTYVLVQNPQPAPVDVSVTYMTRNGQVAGPAFNLPANSRKTIRVNDQLPPDTDVSARVHATSPVIAERSMYWDAGTGEACHDSIGIGAAHSTFYLPDGDTSNGRETWTLVQNPGAADVTVEISYLTPSGGGNVVKVETVPANSRRTFGMLSHSGINGRAAIKVESKTAGGNIIVERAMYWNSRGAGTDTVGAYSN
ncbi:MAG: caspase family protein [Candidatus Geothermincolia bacterium]